MNIDKQIQYWARLINESEDITIDEGLDKDNFRHFFGRLFGVRTDWLDEEDFIDDLIRIKNGKEPSSNYNKLINKIGPKDKDTATAAQLKEYLDHFPNSPFGKELQKKSKERYEVFTQWLHKLWSVKAGEEEKDNEKRRRERIQQADKEREEKAERDYKRAKDDQFADRKSKDIGYSDFGYLDSHSQRIGESDETGSSSLVWRVTIKSNHGIYSSLLEDGETKEDAMQNANKFLKKLGVDSVAVDAEPHKSW